MNRKNASQFLQVKEIDRVGYAIDFVLSTGTVDRHGEVIDQSGWRLEAYLKNPVVLWGHDQSRLPIGKCESIGVVGNALMARVVFAYDQNPEAAMVFELLAGGFLNAGSVGFMNLKWMYDEENDLLTLLENELYEFSIVNVPANPEALAKAIGEMEAKHMDKRVIDKVKSFSADAAARAEARFKDLGEEVKEEDEEDKGEVVADPEQPAPDADPEAVGEESNPVEDAVKSALETLAKASPAVIADAVLVLTGKSKDANTTVEPTPAKQGRAKKISVNSINRALRILSDKK